jgi:predicted amidophosphoribosyltransferase
MPAPHSPSRIRPDTTVDDPFVWPPRPAPPAAPAAVSSEPRDPPMREKPAAHNAAADRSAPRAVPPAPASTGLWAAFQRTWLDLIAPPLAQRAAALGFAPDDSTTYCPRCAQTAGPFESGPRGCPQCTGKRLPWARMVRLGEYRPPLSTFVQEVKFTRWRRLGTDLGRWLGTQINGRLAPYRSNSLPRIVIVPVPITFRRRLFRGIDHTSSIARGVAIATGGTVLHALKRRHRPSQVSLPLSERAANIGKTITLKPGINLRGCLVIVVDDVTTTGATMRASCRAITGAPQHRRSDPAAGGLPPPLVWAGMLAVTPQSRRRAAGAALSGNDPGLTGRSPLSGEQELEDSSA